MSDVSTLWFDADTHQYHWGPLRELAVELMSVSATLGYAGLVRTAYFTPQSRDRGTAVHALTEQFDAGLVDLSMLADDPLLPYVTAWAQFVEDTGAKFSRTEWALAHPDLGYAGTIDRVGTLLLQAKGATSGNGRSRVRRRCVVDIKSGVKTPTHPVQLAAYSALVTRQLVVQGEAPRSAGKLCRICVYLNKKGTYTVEDYGVGGEADVLWASALTVAKFRRFHKLTEGHDAA